MVPEYFKNISKRLLLLIDIEATELEAQDCQSIFKYVRQTEKDKISFDTVGSLCFNAEGIPVNQIPFIGKMLSSGYCELSGAQVVFKKRVITERTISDFIIQLENRYRTLSSAAGKKQIYFPTSQFTTISGDQVKRINVDNEYLHDINPDKVEEKIFEITFEKKGIPHFFIPKNVLYSVKEISISNITYRLAEFAEDKADFYTDIILVYKRQFAGKDRNSLERELAGVAGKTEGEVRKRNTEKIMNRILHHEQIGRSCLLHLLNDNTYVFSRFNVENINDLDFFQSIYTLISFYTSESEKEEVTTAALMTYVKETPSYYLTREELYACMLLEKPKMTEGQQDQAYSQFINELVKRKEDTALPTILRKMIRDGGRMEEILIHKDNLGALVEYEIRKVRKSIPSEIQEDWRKKIKELELIPAMISTIKFREILWYHIENGYFALYQLLRREVEEEGPTFKDYLSALENKGKYTKLLLEYGSIKIEKVLRIDRNALYEKALGMVINELNPFVRFFFIIMHWFKKRGLISSNKDLLEREPKEPAYLQRSSRESLTELESAESESAHGGLLYKETLFSHAGIASFSELRDRLKQLKRDIPDEIPDIGTLMHAILSSFTLGTTVTYAGIIEAYNSHTARLIELSPGLQYNSSFKKYIMLLVFRVVSDNRLELEEGRPKALANALPVFQSVLG